MLDARQIIAKQIQLLEFCELLSNVCKNAADLLSGLLSVAQVDILKLYYTSC